MRFLLLCFCLLTAFEISRAAIPAKKASVFLLDVKQESLNDTLAYPGRVRSRVNAAVTSDIEGQVVRIEKPLGSLVKRGEVVLVIQNMDPLYRYAPIKMRSPSNGYLTSLEVSPFSKVEQRQKLFTVTDPKDLLIEIEIPAHDLSSIKTGMKGEFKLNPTSSDALPVLIEGLSPLIDVRSGTAQALLKPLEKIDDLRQGQLGQIYLKTNPRNSFLIPETSLVYREDKTFVRVLVDGKVVRKPIELGRRMGESFEVKAGVNQGDQLITRTSRYVSDGEEVEVQTQKETK